MDDAALLAELYEEAPCGYLSTRADGTVVKVNRTFEQMTGRPREDLLGTRFSDLLTPGGRIYHETHFDPLLRMQGEVREIALELVRADGSVLPVLVNSVQGNDAVRTTVFDASERRGYERELLSERRRAEHLERRSSFLAEAGRALNEARGVTERAQRIAELLGAETFEAAVVVMADPRRLVAAAGDAGSPPLHAAIDDAVRARRAQLGTGCAAVPLMIGDRVMGAIGVSRAHHVDGISPEELSLLEELAGRAALALENARLYEYERDVAHTLQRSMLAGDPPRHPRCAIGTYYAPAVETLEVGGDWYDAFFLGRDQLALVVGDVVGRGLEAATMMGQLRSAVRALAGAQLGPARVLESLDAFAERNGMSRGATVAYAELDVQSGHMALACAGHPPPVLAAPGRPPELIWGGRSAPLGAYMGPTEREQVELVLPRESRLLLYTDGLVERRDELLDEGLQRLMDAFAGAAETRVTMLGDVLTAAMLADGPVADDVCLLALAFGSSEPFEVSLAADSNRLQKLRRDLGDWLEARGVQGQDRDAVVLACSETAANAIEHAYQGGDGDISVVADTAPGEVTIEVGDRGAWRIPGAHGRGRGLKIVERLMDEVVLDRGRGTRVTMRRGLREPRRRA